MARVSDLPISKLKWTGCEERLLRIPLQSEPGRYIQVPVKEVRKDLFFLAIQDALDPHYKKGKQQLFKLIDELQKEVSPKFDRYDRYYVLECATSTWKGALERLFGNADVMKSHLTNP